MPGFLAHRVIRRDELKGATPRTFLSRLGDALRSKPLLECHGLVHSIKVEKDDASRFTARVQVEHRKNGDEFDPKYVLAYKIRRLRSGDYEAELIDHRTLPLPNVFYSQHRLSGMPHFYVLTEPRI